MKDQLKCHSKVPSNKGKRITIRHVGLEYEYKTVYFWQKRPIEDWLKN